jgi:hypothetical protein
MKTNHKLKELVRSYLLGKLTGEEAQEIEDRYFRDRAFFLWVQSVEVGLIEDYLDGKLSRANVKCFEGRYLRVEDLRKKVDEVQAIHVGRAVEPALRKAIFAVAAVALVITSAIVWRYLYEKKGAARLPTQLAQATPETIRVDLSPGTAQGSESRMTTLQLPAKNVPVEFALELPGGAVSVSCVPYIFEIDAEGKLREIWRARAPVISTPLSTGQQVRFVVDSSQFHHGDFTIELREASGMVVDSYLFRILAPIRGRGNSPLQPAARAEVG